MRHEDPRSQAPDLVPDLISVRHDDEQLLALAADVAGQLRLTARSLLVEGLLYLPRVADAELRIARSAAREELERVGRRIAGRIEGFRDWLVAPTPAIRSPRELRFEHVNKAEARVVLERFHYLTSYRPGAQSYGLRTKGERIAALATLSELDIPTIKQAVATHLAPSEVLVVSRVFAFDWSPRNTISFLLAELARTTRRTRSDARLLITYLNPNLGFNGASYRAANWHLIGEEHGTRYAYLNGVYVTDRELVRNWGTADPTRLTDLLGPRYAVTRAALLPLQLYASPLDAGLNDVLSHRWRFERSQTEAPR
jgi:hypothetical protein